MAGHPNIMNEVESALISSPWPFPSPSSSFPQSKPYQNTQTSEPHEPATIPYQGSGFNHYPNPTHLTSSTSSETKHVCLVCNEDLLVLSNFDRNAIAYFENLCKILQLPIYEEFTAEINPFCVACVKLMDEYFALQKKTQDLISQISTLRTIMAIKVVKSFPLTPCHRQNYGVKQKISQACSNKIDMTKLASDEDFQRTYCTILQSLSTNETNLDAAVGIESGVNERKQNTTSETTSPKIDKPDQLRCVSPTSNHSDNLAGSNEAISEDEGDNEKITQNHTLDELPKFGRTTFFDTPAKITKDGRIVSTKTKKPAKKRSKMCQYCPKEFPTNFAVQMHERSHTGEKPFICQKCGKGCTTKGNLNTHVLTHCKGTTNDEPLSSTVSIRDTTDVTRNTRSEENDHDDQDLGIGKAVNPPNILVRRSNLSCRMCSKIFPSQSQLDTHMRVHTGERPFECSTCGRGFTTKFNMQKHQMTHDETRYQGEPQHECGICHKKFHLKMTLYTHRQDHFRDKSRPSGKTPRRKRIKNTTSTTRGKVPIKTAKKIEANVTDSTHLKESGQSLSDIKIDAFPEPALNFDDDDNGALNDDTHGNDDDIPEVCDDEPSKKIDSKPGKQNRINKSVASTRNKSKPDGPKPEENDPIKETVIGKSGSVKRKRFSQTKKMANKPARKPNVGSKVRRNKTVREIGKKKPVCSVCGKTWLNYYILKEHMRTHTGEKPFACPHPGCNRTFADRGNRMKHFRIHDKTRFDREPEFVCDICGKGYHLAGTLYHHKRRTHQGVNYRYPDVPTTCPICHKFIQRSSHLNEHMSRIHKGERNFKCEICEKPFFSASEAKGHVIFHDPTKLQRILFKYHCTACPPEYIGYPSKEAVRLHWAKDHKESKLPNEFKTIQKQQPVGKYECMECPQDSRPVYKYPRGLQRHIKAYHKGKSASKKFRLTRHNMAKLEVNESDSDSSSGNEEIQGSSDGETHGVKDAARVRTRTLRQRCTSMNYLHDKEREVKKSITRKRLKYKSQVKIGELSANLKALVKALLGNKVLLISLTRVDDVYADVSEEVKTEPISESESD